jgi:hypothetical protein
LVTSTRGQPVTIGYIAEVPLWRASYRLVLGDAGATLQGWALVHNDTDEHWRGVSLELVNGQPDSFLFPLAAPRYPERRLLTPERHLSSAPQLARRSADAMWDEGESGGGFGSGLGLGSVGVVGHGGAGVGYGAAGPVESSLLRVGDLAAQDATSGEAVGALFRYSLSRAIDLDAQKSLLIPFLRETVAVKRVTVFVDADARGQASIVLDNTTQQTLPPGTMALFEGGGFAGESATDRVEPGQRRVLPFGIDLDVQLKAEPNAGTKRLRFLTFERGRVQQHYLSQRHVAYSVENRGVHERDVHVVLDAVNNATLRGGDDVFVDDAAERVHAVFRVPATSRKAYTVHIDEGLSEEVMVAKLESAMLRRWLLHEALPGDQRTVLEKALVPLAAHERILRRRETLRQEMRSLDARLERLESALGVVRVASAEESEILSRRIVDSEERRARLSRELAAVDPYPPLARTKAILLGLNAGVPKG